MTGAWMVFILAISAVTGAAAWLADAGLRRLGRPSRWVWLAGLWAPALAAAAVLLPVRELLAALGLSPSRAGEAVGTLSVVELPGLAVGAGAAPAAGTLGTLLLAGWLASTVTTLGVLVRAHRRLGRERAGWRTATVLGHRAWISPGRGPAVAGVLRPWILLPEWVLHLPEDELRLVLAHEAEHLRTRDPLVLSMGWLAVALAPWNPAAWWQLRRLRSAMEVDCDRRVLARHPDPRTYGASLLTVAERATGGSLALAAFSERPSNLEQRIRTMTETTTRTAKIFGTLLLVVAAGVAVQACGVDSPVSSSEEDGSVPPAGTQLIVPEDAPRDPPPPDLVPRDQLADTPAFTPFTVAPSIANRQEVVAAMQREYPPLLREAGISGTVRVYFFIDENGRVQNRLIDQSSGHEALDRAALAVADVYRFSSARNGDERVPVWVSFPITFRPAESGS